MAACRSAACCGRSHHHHADPQVEHPEHLFVRNPAAALDQLEEGRHGPAAPLDPGAQALRQDARDILEESAAGEMGQGLDRLRGSDLER